MVEIADRSIDVFLFLPLLFRHPNELRSLRRVHIFGGRNSLASQASCPYKRRVRQQGRRVASVRLVKSQSNSCRTSAVRKMSFPRQTVTMRLLNRMCISAPRPTRYRRPVISNSIVDAAKGPAPRFSTWDQQGRAIRIRGSRLKQKYDDMLPFGRAGVQEARRSALLFNASQDS
jgi:hypothetical protein